jgi:protocadherin Fat 1/2/3
VKLVSELPVQYKLVSGNELCSIDVSGQITLTGQLDRETVSSHILGIIALSDSSPPLTAVTEISLQVLDFNDNKPIFLSEGYSTTIAENLEEGSSILKGFVLKFLS